MSKNDGEADLAALAPFSWQQQQWHQILGQFRANRLAHSTLVWGESGLGKVEFINSFSRLMLCQQPTAERACGSCKSCLLVKNNSHPDLQVLAPEAGSKEIKIDQVRAVTDFVNRTSHAGGAKIAIIDRAHRLNISSANALLKTLEEPSNNTYLFLITNLPGRLKPTIRSLPDNQSLQIAVVGTINCRRWQRLRMVGLSLPGRFVICRDWLSGRLQADVIDSAVQAASNRPLLALELASSGAVTNRQEFIAALTELSRARAPIQAPVNLANKMGESAAIEYLLWISSILVKFILTAQMPSAADDSGVGLCSLFSTADISRRGLAVALLCYQQELSTARKQLMSGANPNPQLIMESLMWRWSELCRQSLGQAG
jgi:DNA polymerase-3 subunit delta'